MTAIAVLLLTAVSPGHRPATVDGIIADTHARSAALRREMLADWTFPWQGAGYMASFSAAPVQAVVAAMFLNENATAVAAAQEALHNMSVPGPGRFNACYEWTVLARAFAMFNSRSGFNATARMRPETELALKEMVFSYAALNGAATKFCEQTLPSEGGSVMCQDGSENLDIDAKTSAYILLAELSKHPEYKDRFLSLAPPPPPPRPPSPLPRCNHCCKHGCGAACCSALCCCLNVTVCPPGPAPPPPPDPRLNLTVSTAAAEWEIYFHEFSKQKALSGLMSELGSPNYWYRTYPALFNLIDLGSPRVRKRATMFMDLAMLDGEQLVINGVRAGFKMRAKKDGGIYDGDPDDVFKYQAGAGRCAHGSLAPVLYGEGRPPVWAQNNWQPHFAARVIELETSSYRMGPTAIVVHNKTAGLAVQPTYTVRNRLLGQMNSTHPSLLSTNSSLVHYFHRTPTYGAGSLIFNPNPNPTGRSGQPNRLFGAPPQESFLGATFANEDRTTIGIPHSSGTKWSAQTAGALVAAKCPKCAYNGDFAVELYNVSSTWMEGGWAFAQAANGLDAWAAITPAWGGFNFTAGVNSSNTCFRLVPNDPSAAMVLFIGDASQFGDRQNFTSAVVGARPTHTSDPRSGSTEVHFTPPGGLPTIRFPWSDDVTKIQLPSIGNSAVDDTPVRLYDGPYMTATLGEDVVSTSASALGVQFEISYDFNQNRLTTTGAEPPNPVGNVKL